MASILSNGATLNELKKFSIFKLQPNINILKFSQIEKITFTTLRFNSISYFSTIDQTIAQALKSRVLIKQALCLLSNLFTIFVL